MAQEKEHSIGAAVAVMVALIALLLSLPAVASASNGRGHNSRTLAVSAIYTEPAEQVDGARCSGLEGSQPGCQYVLHGDATFTGTFSGNAPFDCWGDSHAPVTLDGKLLFACTDYVRGVVQRCGKGSFIIDDYDAYVDIAKTDPSTGTAPGYNKWRIRPNSGTGDLVGISGQGVNHWTEHWVGEADTSQPAGTGHFTGSVTCRG